MTAWIRMIPDAEAKGLLKRLYDKVRTPHGTVDNVMRAHSLRPHTMDGHVTLYRSVLHNPDNTLPFWFLEVVASYTSIVNDCAYSLAHHFTNVRRLLKDEARADTILEALEARAPERAFAGKELAKQGRVRFRLFRRMDEDELVRRSMQTVDEPAAPRSRRLRTPRG